MFGRLPWLSEQVNNSYTVTKIHRWWCFFKPACPRIESVTLACHDHKAQDLSSLSRATVPYSRLKNIYAACYHIRALQEEFWEIKAASSICCQVVYRLGVFLNLQFKKKKITGDRTENLQCMNQQATNYSLHSLRLFKKSCAWLTRSIICINKWKSLVPICSCMMTSGTISA